MSSTETSTAELYKALPSVDKLLQSPPLQSLLAERGQSAVKAEIRLQLENLRSAISADTENAAALINSAGFMEQLAARIIDAVASQQGSSLRQVINLTGTVIHTNLGRASMPHEAVAAMEVVATSASNLEYDLEAGARGDRDAHIEALICELCGAEAATVVNNNAAAVLLLLNTLAHDREVLISRGELVEIGGSFRIPDVMSAAGCKLKEVGTTNRTHLKDFANAIDEHTALLMRVHTSNYEVKGFTKSVPMSELSALAKEKGLPFASDLGSGTLIDLTRFGLPDEPTVASELNQGADLVTFSGDKLLGGPQAGVIVGSKALVDRIKKNPLKRALRVDKTTMAALTQVLQLYQDPDRLKQRLPVLRDLTRSPHEIRQLADSLLGGVQQCLSSRAEVSIEACKSQIGSGSLPTDLLDSYALAITPMAEKGERDASLVNLAAGLRKLPKPIIGRIHDGKLLLDLRCLRDGEEFLGQLALLS